MSATDPRDEHNLLRTWEKEQEEGNPVGLFAPRRRTRPPEGAMCEKCGCKELSALPAFSAGSGVAARPFSDDVRCHRCGHIAPPAL